MQLKPGLELSCVLAIVLLCLLHDAIAAQPVTGVGISGSWPSSVSQYVQTTVRVTLNTSACSHWGQDAANNAQLILQHVTAKGGSLAFRSSSSASADRDTDSAVGDCTSFDFPVLLNGTSRHGNVTARLLLPKVGLDLRLQEPIVVQVPLLLSVVNEHLNVSADSTPFKVTVSLSRPAPAGGVAVQLQLGEPGAAKVDSEALYWPEGAEGRRDFILTLQAAPRASLLRAKLHHATGGAVLSPAAAAVDIAVQSPVISFSSNLGYYRGLQNSSAPKLWFNATGSSAFPTEFAFSTFVLPGSRPSPFPCHPLAPSCSMAEQEAVSNVTLLGRRRLEPGQVYIAPLRLPLSWGRLPAEAELRVGVKITALSNGRVAEQAGAAAAIIFGTPPEHCPPGAVLATGASNPGSNSSSLSERPTYTQVAALQELALVLAPADGTMQMFGTDDLGERRHHRRRTLSADSSSNSSSGGSNTSGGQQGGINATASTSNDGPQDKAPNRMHTVVTPNAAAAANASVAGNSTDTGRSSTTLDLDPPFRPLVDRYFALLPPGPSVGQLMLSSSRWGDVVVAGNSTDTGRSSTTLDLDPPFRPLVDRYFALLPPGPSVGQLMLSSSRWGDVVVVDTTACSELESARYTVKWGKGQQLWREHFPLAGQNVPCWVRVHVFTPLENNSSAAAAPADDSTQGPSTEEVFNGVNVARGPGLRDPAGNAATPAAVAAAFAGRRPLQAPPGSGSGSSSNAPADNLNSSSSSSSKDDVWGSPEGPTNGIASSPSVWDLPAGFVLYRSYTVRFVPLRPAEQMSLRAITFTNNNTVVIACGVPEAYEHLFLRPKSLGPENAQIGLRPSSIMSSTFTAARSGAPGLAQSAAPRSTAAAAGAAVGSAFAPLVAEEDWAEETSAGSNDPPPSLKALPGVDVQVAYLLMKPPGSADSSTVEQSLAAVKRIPDKLRMQQFSVVDRSSNRTIVWSRFTAAECARDHYILLPMAQLKPDMRMVPELLDPEGFAAGVKIAMSQAAVALPRSSDSDSSSTRSSLSSPLGVPSEGSSSVAAWLLGQKFHGAGFGSSSPAAGAAAAAAVDGGKGFGGAGQQNLGDQVWCGNSSSGVKADHLASSSVGGSGSSSGHDGCKMQLPGLTAELPIILTADEGRSSRTYTMLLYSNATAATAVHELVLPQEAAAGGVGGIQSDDGSSSQAAEGAALSAAFFASRPAEWPRSPAQSDRCEVCPNGTYSTRTDATECKVCPPGKYAGSPFSTTCLYCPPGTFSYYWGAPTCRTCLPGTYAAAAGSLFCDICKEGTTTRSEGAVFCEMSVAGGGTASSLDHLLASSDVAILLSFGLLLDGTSLESVSRSLTGINGSSEGIVGVLVRGDTASALNISLGSVQVMGVRQIGSRQLLVNVSAALPVSADQAAAAVQQDLSADPLIQRLIDDPNTFLRTTQTLGAESASVQDITTQMTQRAKWRHTLQLHAILWPTLAGVLLLLGAGTWSYRRRRRRQQQLAQITSGRTDPAAAVAVGGVGGLFGTTLQQRSGRNAGAALQGRHAGQAAGGASVGPGWFYGDGFMHGSSAAAAGAADLSRVSVNSSDAGDGIGPHGARNVGGALRNLRWLLSTRIRFVLKMQGNCADAGFTCSDGRTSPDSTSSPDRSSCGEGSVADSMERGEDELRVRVELADDNVGGSPALSPAGPGSSSSLPLHGLCMHEESFATRLRAKQQQQVP